MYAVMGITGQVGAAVADALLADGKQVRGVVRNAEKAAAWKARGVELVVADYEDEAGLAAAFRGVEGAFVMIPPYFAPSPGFTEAKAAIAALRTALDAARPPKVVCLSSIGAEKTSKLGLIITLHMLEEALGTLPIPSAFLRASWFMENSAWDVGPAREQGKLFAFLQPLDKKFPMVATRDIGRAAADTLQQSWTGKRYIEVTGASRYSSNDIAATFATVLGRKVEAVEVPRETWVNRFVAQGPMEDRITPRIEMLDNFNSGWIDFGAAGTERFTGKTKLEDVFRVLVAKG